MPHDVGMYLRKIQRRNKGGSVVRYLQLAHNHRTGGTTQAEVLVNLGREDQLDTDGLRRLVASINRYLGDEHDVVVPLGADTTDANPLVVQSARPIGALSTTWPATTAHGSLRCTSCAGTGYSHAARRTLRSAREQITRHTSPLDAPTPAAVERWARWVDPVFVADAEDRELTGKGILQHPSFRGIRADRSPEGVGWPR